MSKAERGTKRVCQGCGAKFYDLNRDPIVCPVCQAVFATEEAAPAESAAPEKAPEPAEEKETAEAVTAAAATTGPEIISLSEVEEEESGEDVDIDEADIGLGNDEDSDIPDSDEDDDTFLETDDEEGANVSDIIPTSVKSDGEDS